MVGKAKPQNKVNLSESLVVDTSNVIVKQEQQCLLSPQSNSSEHSSTDLQSIGQSFTLGDDSAIIKYEDDSNNENTSSNDKPDR